MMGHVVTHLASERWNKVVSGWSWPRYHRGFTPPSLFAHLGTLASVVILQANIYSVCASKHILEDLPGNLLVFWEHRVSGGAMSL